MAIFKPREYQIDIMRFIKENKRGSIWAAMGTGKTVSTLTAIHDLSLIENVYPILIVAPLRVAKTTWPTELQKWDHLSGIRVSVIAGTPKERQQALRGGADIYTVNYEQLPKIIEHYGDNWPFPTVVIDESTKLKGFRTRQGTKRAKALAQIAHTKIKRIILLTGTPAPNGLQDLWGQTWFVDKGERLGKSFSSFKERWFTTDHSGFNLIALKHSQNEIHERLADISLTIKAEDYFDLKKPIVNKIRIDLPNKTRELYNDMEKRMFMELAAEPIEALNAAAKTMKCLQITSGAVYLEDKSYEVLHDEKIEALGEIIEEAAGMPVLVAYHFKSDLSRLLRSFPRGRALDDNPKTLQEWNSGKIPILFVHPKSAGHGLNLQDGSNILAFFSLDWNLEEHLQVIERIGPVRQMQSGYNRSVFIHYILAQNTVDELVLERLETKREVQDILLDAMNRRSP